jgi:uncharacterized protein YbjT (DUF2867 family)
MGATGHVGAAVVRGLVERGEAVRAVSRRDQDWPAGVTGVVADPMESGSLDAAAAGVDRAFVMSGYAAEAGLLASLRDAHVVLLSASSADLGAGDNPLARMHLDSERAVLGSGLPHTFLRPCSFQSNILRWREQLVDGDVVRAPFVDVPVAMVDPADVAAVAVVALTQPGHLGAVHRLSGPDALLPREQVQLLGEALGRELSLEEQPDDEAGAAGVDIFRRHPELESEVQDTVPALLGRPAGSLQDWLASNRAAFDPGQAEA